MAQRHCSSNGISRCCALTISAGNAALLPQMVNKPLVGFPNRQGHTSLYVRGVATGLDAGIEAKLDLLRMQPLRLGHHVSRHRGTLSIEAPLRSWHLRDLRASMPS